MPAVDVLHVCFGGMGGVRSVVNSLTEQFDRVGLTTGVVPVGRVSDLDDGPRAWPGARVVVPVVVRRRADVGSMASAVSIARRVQARVVFIHSPRHALPFYAGRRLSGQTPRLVTVEHSSVNDRSRALDVNSASALACSRAVVFLTAENEAGYPLRKAPFPALSRTAVIANGISLADFEAVHRHASGSPEEFRIGMASRIVPAKDFDTLIRAVAVLQRRSLGTPVRLILAGDGPELPRIRALAHRLGAERAIDFLGAIPESGMPGYLATLDAFVQATHGETLSMSLLQAAAARVPIVASDVAGVNDIFTQGVDARLTPHGDVEALADGILEVLTDPVLAGSLAAGAHDLVAARYTSAQMAVAYLRLLDRIDAEGPWAAAADILVEAW